MAVSPLDGGAARCDKNTMKNDPTPYKATFPAGWREQLRDGVLPLLRTGMIEAEACRAVNPMLEPYMLRVLAREDKQFAAEYEIAQEEQAHARADGLLALHEDCETDPKRLELRAKNEKWWLERRHKELYGQQPQGANADVNDVLGALREAIARIPRPDAAQLDARPLDIEPAEPDDVEYVEYVEGDENAPADDADRGEEG